ncbi:MAG: hypothetical protein ACI4EF_03460, partial [Coprococcus sp.]
MNRKLNILKKVFVLCVVFCMIVTLTACGDDNEEKTETTEEIKNGEVASPEEFKKLGLYIDVKSSYIKDVKYSIEDNEIAVISFVYNGIDCQFRGSCTYEDYDLAKVMNTSTGDMLSTTLKGYGATYYTLVPGRIVFWDAGHVNYSFYTFVTASDEV